jgi:beta-lactam-binding protein with PASTA domain/tRNA A-37 threonylcarbamoyl transferase component Bud32
MADQVGRVLGGRYRLVAPIGTGASAHVYVADDVSLRRRVAVKVLHAALASDESFLRRFRAEAQAVAALRHPNIMSVYDWGEDEDGPYLVLEHLGGGSLRDLLDRGSRLSPSQALLVGLEAARALDYAHRRGLVHRDVKPANLLFDDEGRLCIADFGLARALAEAAWTEPAGAVLGTARYASPEQARGATVDGKADVYALAIVLVEAVTGQVPFAADTTIATLMARLDRPLDVPDSLGTLAPVLRRAAVIDPADRLDAGGLVRALEAAAEDLPRPEPLPLAGSPTVELGLTRDRDVTELPPPRREVPVGADWPPAPRRRRWALALVGAVLAAALVAGAAYGVVQARIPTHPVPQLRELTLDAARQEVREERFRVIESRREYDELVPAERILDQEPSSLRKLKEGGTIEVVVSRGPEPRLVPDLAGLDLAAADAALRGKGFVPRVEARFDETVPKGMVLEWSPNDGQKHDKGTEVRVVVSDGKAPKEIPGFADKPYDQYRRLLEDLGLVPRRVDEFSDTAAKGRIVETRPPAGQQAPVGSEVVVVVSKGPETVAVPNVVGREFGEAKETLEAAGLQVAGPFGPPRAKARVFDTDPPPGARVPPGTVVNVFVR